MTQIPAEHRRGRIQDAVSDLPTGGTVTLEQWKRLRAEKRSSVHVVKHSPSTRGDNGGDAA